MTSPKSHLTASVLLWMIEEDRAAIEKHWGKPCPVCKEGILYRGNWRCKGELPKDFAAPDDFLLRFSLCCSNRECRRRFTLPSLRFPPRGKYSTVVLLLIKLLHVPKSETSARKLAEIFCVSLSTVRRWLSRWLTFCKAETRWRQLQREIFQLGGGGFDKVVENLREIHTSTAEMFKCLVNQCHELWNEWQCRLTSLPQAMGPECGWSKEN